MGTTPHTKLSNITVYMYFERTRCTKTQTHFCGKSTGDSDNGLLDYCAVVVEPQLDIRQSFQIISFWYVLTLGGNGRACINPLKSMSVYFTKYRYPVKIAEFSFCRRHPTQPDLHLSAPKWLQTPTHLFQAKYLLSDSLAMSNQYNLPFINRFHSTWKQELPLWTCILRARTPWPTPHHSTTINNEK